MSANRYRRMSNDPNGSGIDELANRPRRPGMGWLALGVIVLALAMPTFLLLDPEPSRMWFNPGLIAFMPSLYSSPFGRVFGGGWRGLDERELSAFDRAMRAAYLALVGLMLVAVAALALATSAGIELHPAAAKWVQLGQALVVTVMLLPIAFAELLTPLPPPEDHFHA